MQSNEAREKITRTAPRRGKPTSQAPKWVRTDKRARARVEELTRHTKKPPRSPRGGLDGPVAAPMVRGGATPHAATRARPGPSIGSPRPVISDPKTTTHAGA